MLHKRGHKNLKIKLGNTAVDQIEFPLKNIKTTRNRQHST